MNENRSGKEDTNWLTHDQLLKGTEQFLRLNKYFDIEYNKVSDQGGARTFSSPIVASRRTTVKYNEKEEEIAETIVSIFKSKIQNYDLGSLAHIESITFSILDNFESINPMLVTDSLSYPYIINSQEINVAIEDMMRDGLFILFLNHHFAYALFDKFENLTKPIAVYDRNMT